MRRLTPGAKLVILGIWLIVACIAYYGAMYLGFIYIVPVFLGLITVAAIAYILVNGGFSAVSKEQRMNKDGESDLPVRPNPLNLSLETRMFWSDLLLIIGLVPLAVILVDYMLMLFGVL